MYTARGFNEWGIGDVDVVKVGDTYHLFHLFLPNHAFIAHATSKDGLSWTRAPNALFIGDPGSWDDDMLWTMHVTPDPEKPDSWRMFYTGLRRNERGRVQRVGLAVSDDLYRWKKVEDGFPLSIPGPHYESTLHEGRHWVSFRDPFYLRVNGEGWLLAAARVKDGPIVRRGCVSLAAEVAPGRFEFRPPLFCPRRYDDIEVPALVELEGRFFLIGSTREDVKVHYWYADRPEGPYRPHVDNVLLPSGNYAARVCDEGDRYTLWNFYSLATKIKGTGHMLPPPKTLVKSGQGELELRSFEGFDGKVVRSWNSAELVYKRLPHGHASVTETESGVSCWLSSEASFELFLLDKPRRNFRLRGQLRLEGRGKCGLVLRMSEQTDGYLISLDLFKGVVQARASGNNPGGIVEDSFVYEPLQANYFQSKGGQEPYDFCLVAFGDYIELSLDGRVLLSFADARYREGYMGYYVDGAKIRIDDVVLDELQEPRGESYAIEGPPGQGRV